MRNRTLALGAATLACALGPGSSVAAADQTIHQNAGAVQVGDVTANAPVRVASRGGPSAAGPAAGGGSQSVSHSVGAAQVGTAAANAPVSVASRGGPSSAGPAA